MEIRVGKYIMRSDKYSLWIDEEYETKDAKGRAKTATRRVAGYSRTLEQLYKSFAQHKYRASEAETVKELLKVFQQTEADILEMRKTAAQKDFRIIRNIAKEIDNK